MNTGADQARLEECARALSAATADFPDVAAAFELIMAPREARGAMAFAVESGGCDPACPPGKKCVFNPLSLKWRCFP